MPVEIICDPGRLLEPAGFDYVVTGTADYVTAAQLLKQAIRIGGAPLRRILVQVPAEALPKHC